jgi:hypothetical protein
MFWVVYHIAYGRGMFHGCLFLLFAANIHINTSVNPKAEIKRPFNKVNTPKQVIQQSVWRNTSLRKSFKKTPKRDDPCIMAWDHYIIHHCITKETHCHIHIVNNFEIMIANEGSMKCDGNCDNVKLQMGDYFLKMSVFTKIGKM